MPRMGHTNYYLKYEFMPGDLVRISCQRDYEKMYWYELVQYKTWWTQERCLWTSKEDLYPMGIVLGESIKENISTKRRWRSQHVPVLFGETVRFIHHLHLEKIDP